MNSKRVREWLGTANGLVKSVVALVGVLATIFAATTKAFEPVVDVPMAPSWASPAVAVILIALLGLWLERSFRRFAQASRLERPDAFRLRPTNPASLMGRNEDLVRLITCVKHKRLVLMDGESGCGKSALVSAGLVPSLRQSDGLLPIAIRDWGDDWVRGPLSAAVEAIFHAVSQTERDRLAWTSSPDLAADTDALVADLDARLKAVVGTLGRRPLLIADQFDDYRARHYDQFLAQDGTWLGATALARANRFWELVSAGLSEGRLHLLVVTRADTAAGLACVRFLGEDQTAVLTLPRVEIEYLRPRTMRSRRSSATQPVVGTICAKVWSAI